VLFDVDGTLAVPAQKASDEMIALLGRLRQVYAVGIVGAGDFQKQQGQLGGFDLRERLDFCFSENGVHAFRGTEQIHCKSFADHLGEKRWQKFREELDKLLASERAEAERLLKVASPEASLDGRGTFLEIRQCTINICPIQQTPKQHMRRSDRARADVLGRCWHASSTPRIPVSEQSCATTSAFRRSGAPAELLDGRPPPPPERTSALCLVPAPGARRGRCRGRCRGRRQGCGNGSFSPT
ncbi:unnamed protein product, partial [Prorocentrum cordatum]